jgi:hypothetical protein
MDFHRKFGHYPRQELTMEAAKKQLVRNTWAWENTQGILSNVEADMLLIFDCCYAGDLRERASRRYEFLAACTGSQTTSIAGDRSFTHALIWALKDLACQNKPFDTASLRVRITKAPAFPEKQYPQLFPHNGENADHIWLAPLHPEAEASPGPVEDKMKLHYLDLRFHFNEALNDKEIEATATRLNDFIKENTSILSLRRVSFKKKYSVEKMARDVLIRWRRPSKALTPSPVLEEPDGVIVSSIAVMSGSTDETSTSAYGNCGDPELLLGKAQDHCNVDCVAAKYHADMGLRSLLRLLKSLLQFICILTFTMLLWWCYCKRTLTITISTTNRPG